MGTVFKVITSKEWDITTLAEKLREVLGPVEVQVETGLPTTQPTSTPIIEYEGRGYVRHLGRGIVLEDSTPGDTYLEDVVPEGRYQIVVRFFALPAGDTSSSE